MPSNTKTLQNSIDWAKYFVGLRPLALPNSSPLEPSLTSANTIIQTILQPPFRWRWNRNTVSFLMIDPKGWLALEVVTLGYRIRDINGNMQTVTTPGTTGSSQPTWNMTVGGTTFDGSVTWTTSLGTDYIQSVSDFGFIEKAQITALTGSGMNTVYEIVDIKQEMSQDNGTGRSTAICPFLDDNQGNITLRFMPGIPDQLYQCTVTYQKQPVLMTALSSVWPIPDRYGMVYQQGFLGFTYLFANSEYTGVMLQKFVASLLALAEGLTEQERNIFMEQWQFTIEAARAGARASQGLQARSAS